MSRPERHIAAGLLVSLVATLVSVSVTRATEASTTSSRGNLEPAAAFKESTLIATMRKLSELQQRVVDGHKKALAEQLTVARTISSELQRNPASSWQKDREFRSLAKFVLSGGDPKVLGRLVDSAALAEADLPLARGVLAYALGDGPQAAAQLDAIDHRLLHPSLAGHLALVKAAILTDSSAPRALELCREAILLSPGTHIEEAALRLSIALAIKIGDISAVERSHRRHLLRFSTSLYASDADTRVAGVFVANPNGGAIEPSAINGISALVTPPRRRSFFARLADAGLRAGKLQTAIMAARLALSAPESAETSDVESTATLLAIEGAALILTSERKTGMRRLDEASAAGPSTEAARLIATARALVTMIQAPPAQAAKVSAAPSSDTSPAAAAPPAEASSRSRTPLPGSSSHQVVQSKGHAALAMADKLIEQASK